MDRTAEQLARTLDYLVSEGRVPGLLPQDVSAAAERLRQQEAELVALRKAVAANKHSVDLTVTMAAPYRRKITMDFVIADPRLYRAEMTVGDLGWMAGDRDDWIMHVGKQLARVGTGEWLREIEELAIVAVARNLRRDEADWAPQGFVRPEVMEE